MVPGIVTAAVASGKIKRPSALGNVGLSENTHPRITFLFFFFLQMETTKDENPLQYEKERSKAFKIKLQQGEGKVLCECTYLHRR